MKSILKIGAVMCVLFFASVAEVSANNLPCVELEEVDGYHNGQLATHRCIDANGKTYYINVEESTEVASRTVDITTDGRGWYINGIEVCKEVLDFGRYNWGGLGRSAVRNTNNLPDAIGWVLTQVGIRSGCH